MKKLTVSKNSAAMHELLRRLEEAGFKSAITNDFSVTELDLGVQRFIVWIDDHDDLDRAIAMVREMETEQVAVKCLACGYDLSGHHGAVRCPECGYALTAPSPDVPCPHCGEDVPADFEICWNCSAEMGESS